MSVPVFTERNADEIAADVDRGLVVFAEIEKLKQELKAIEGRLAADALARPDEHEPLADEAREGKQFIAVGSELSLPIVLTADKLVQSFTEGSKAAVKIASACPGNVEDFYTRTVTYGIAFDDGKAFRAYAMELLGKDAPRFIAACVALDKDGLPKSDIKIEWKRAAAHAKLEEVAK